MRLLVVSSLPLITITAINTKVVFIRAQRTKMILTGQIPIVPACCFHLVPNESHIFSLIASQDFRNYRYTLPVVPGLTVDLEAQRTCIKIPTNGYDEVQANHEAALGYDL